MLKLQISALSLQYFLHNSAQNKDLKLLKMLKKPVGNCRKNVNRCDLGRTSVRASPSQNI